MDAFTAQAWKMMLTPAVRDAFDLSKESEKTKERYGKDASASQPCWPADWSKPAADSSQRRAITAIPGTRTATTTRDTATVLRPRSTARLTALVEDLDERGLLSTTLVIAMGEFGRTPMINPHLGRDHWPNCWSMALAGARHQDGPGSRRER